MASPLLSFPQQVALPFVLIPHVWSPPAPSAVKVPAGGVDWPSRLRPQHATLPFVLIPHVWRWPALTATKVPAGGVD